MCFPVDNWVDPDDVLRKAAPFWWLRGMHFAVDVIPNLGKSGVSGDDEESVLK